MDGPLAEANQQTYGLLWAPCAVRHSGKQLETNAKM